MKSKYVKESLNESRLNEDDFELWSEDDDKENFHEMSEIEEEDVAEFSSQLEQIFQAAANKGMPFEVMQDLVEQTLNEIDWVDAGQM